MAWGYGESLSVAIKSNRQWCMLYPLRAAVGRAYRLQPAVSLVRRPGHRRRGVEPCGVLEEPRPPVHIRDGAALLR